MKRLRAVKPGWYLLGFFILYSLVATVALTRAERVNRDLRAPPLETVAETPPEVAPTGLWFPVPGASLPQTAAYLPGADRAYRRGVNQGFDFYGEDAGIPIQYGTPVVAAADGVVTRADSAYSELGADAWDTLLKEVFENGAGDEQLDRLRGRQLWLQTDDGLSLRYGHLSSLGAGIALDAPVYRGQVVGFVGNSGTDDGVTGTTRGARLHFEVWRPDGTFFGQEMTEETLRSAADTLFVGP
ncbi:hypothetical protein BH24DEI2_BH24DEI2_08960 [soil metagenome]